MSYGEQMSPYLLYDVRDDRRWPIVNDRDPRRWRSTQTSGRNDLSCSKPSQITGMHEMRKSETVQHHPHRHVDGRKEVYNMQKFNDKASSSSNTIRTDQRSKSHNLSSQIPGAIRICGDWSEHLSSNGKVYFFNNKTKSSQWEKPKEWNSSRAVDAKKDKAKSAGAHNRVSSKHSNDTSSSTACSNSHNATRQQKNFNDIKKQQTQQRVRTNNDSQSNKDRDYRTSSGSRDRDYRDIDYRDNRLSNNVDSRSQNQDRDYRSSGTGSQDTRPNMQRQLSRSTKDYNGKNTTLPNHTHPSLQRSESRTHNDGSLKEEKPRSNNSSPRLTSDVKKESVEAESSGANGDAVPSKSDLVQTLSTVLKARSAASDKNKEGIEGHLKNALQMLLSVAAKNQQISAGTNDSNTVKEPQQAIEEEPPPKKVRTSDPIDEHIISSIRVSESAEKVLNDLRSSIDERHLLHVQGWPAEQLERQSVRLCDENHQFVVNHTSQLTTAMKVSRSQVRSSEIHSTLQEQRILYLRQQIKDLEKSTTNTPFT